MKKLLSIPAYIWAVACLIIIPVTFIQNDSLAEKLAGLSFMKVHPVYSGGELNRMYEKDSLKITVNHPVETTLFKNKKKLMVQVTFSVEKGLPEIINQVIDYNFDHKPDFGVIIHTVNGQTSLQPLNPSVISLRASSKVKEDWIIRVNIKEE